MAEIAKAHRERPFAGVVYWREPYVVVATHLAERLGLPVVLENPMFARDKFAMKKALRAQSVRCAESAVVARATDLDHVRPSLFPGVLKPRYAFASICAVRVDDILAARRELAEKRDKLRTTHIERVDLGVPPEPDFVLESFVGGSEHTVESFVANGDVTLQIVSDKLPMLPPHFVETGDVMPSRLGEEAQSLLRDAARRSIAALGIRWGWTHTEIKLWNGEAWVMEVGARMGGGYTRELVRAAFGLDMLRALFDYVSKGTAPVLGPPRAVALGRRFVVSGLSLVWDAHAVEKLGGERRVAFLPRESSKRRRGVFLGAPYSYEGTVAAYLLSARDGTELDALDRTVSATLAPKQIAIPLPRTCYRAYLATKRALDVLGLD
jgi:hypothetical protein